MMTVTAFAQQLVRARLVTYTRQLSLVEACREAARQCPTMTTLTTLKSAEEQGEWFFARLRAAVSFAESVMT